MIGSGYERKKAFIKQGSCRGKEIEPLVVVQFGFSLNRTQGKDSSHPLGMTMEYIELSSRTLRYRLRVNSVRDLSLTEPLPNLFMREYPSIVGCADGQ